MRDHPQHTIPILAGTWDTDLTRKKARSSWKQAWRKMLKDPLAYAARDKHGSDQFLLERLENKIRLTHMFFNNNCKYTTEN